MRTSSLRARAFTLLEILIVLALIGLLSGVLVSGAGRLLKRGPLTPEQIFWQMVATTRRHALQHSADVVLRFDEKARTLIARATDGKEIGRATLPEGVKLEFLAGAASGPSILLAGERVETTVVPRVTFYTDGTCTPFRVQLRGASGNLGLITIDPWTCARSIAPVVKN
jgi:prepilin-type N-terminal cleavage/methylation domain-containing protein